MNVIYMQGQSPFHPDPMVQEMDDMAEYAAAARQQAYGNPVTPAEAVSHFAYDDEDENALEAAEGIVYVLKVMGGVLGAIALVSLLAATGVFA